MGRSSTRWVNLGLLNLCMVALLGFILRTKILFSIPWIDYRNILTAHGNFALSGWIGMVILSLLVYKILPAERAGRRIYDFLLAAVFILSWAMLLSYSFAGPAGISLVFSWLFILLTYTFSYIYIKDIWKLPVPGIIKMTSILALVCLVLASSGSIALALMYMGAWKLKISYRDASYIFLHFQYNGFFTLGIGSLFLKYIVDKGGALPRSLRTAVNWIAIATIPSVFLSLLYYEKTSFYIIGAITGFMLLTGGFYFLKFLAGKNYQLLQQPWARGLWIMAGISFLLKMVMQVGTLTPLGHEVYSDRPVIIGFLHMVFLAFASFFLLGIFTEEGFFSRKEKVLKFPLFVFILGVLANETFLMIQGIEILLKTNNPVYNWLLWFAAILLFMGALLLGTARILSSRK